MNNVNKTLYIPLYGKACISRRGILLRDPKAEEIWAAEGFPLKGKAKSKWLALYMAMRGLVFDQWVQQQMEADPGAVVLHIGCGMDSRALRVENRGNRWFDVDFPEVIAQRRRYFPETETYEMIGADIREENWLAQLPKGNAIVVMEGVSMYLQRQELTRALGAICSHFQRVNLMMDCYTEFAAKASRVKNPINEVGVTEVYGMDDPREPEGAGLTFLQEHDMTPEALIDQLRGMEKAIFRRIYAGSLAKKLYRLYEYRATEEMQR